MPAKKSTKSGRTPTDSYSVIRVESWGQFVELATAPPYLNWAFRGQADAQWSLTSTLSRYLKSYVDPGLWEEREKRIVRVFQRKAHHFLSHLPDKDDHFRWLALMQHHGAPTRLLDFTWSAYVAAFFAMERSKAESAVWALNPAETRFVTEHFDEYMKSSDESSLWIGEPYEMNKRLIAQSGTFVISKSLKKPIERIVEERKRSGDTLVKFVLPRDLVRQEGLRALFSMNLTNATLFPDLDGLARSMAYELEFSWA